MYVCTLACRSCNICTMPDVLEPNARQNSQFAHTGTCPLQNYVVLLKPICVTFDSIIYTTIMLHSDCALST